MQRLRLPIDWLVFTAIMGWIWGWCILAYGLLVWHSAASSGNPAAFAEVPRGVWIGGLSGLALAPVFWALARLIGVEWVRIQGGCSDPALFSRYPLVESQRPETVIGRLGAPAGWVISKAVDRPWLRLLLYLFAATTPLVARGTTRLLDLNPLGTVMIFGFEEGRVELAIIAVGLVYLAWAVVDAVARIQRVQRP